MLSHLTCTATPREAFVLRHRFGLAAASEAAAAAFETTIAAGGSAVGSRKMTDESWLKATEEEVATTLRDARSGGAESDGGDGPVVSRQVLGSLLGVSGETVRTIEVGLCKLRGCTG